MKKHDDKKDAGSDAIIVTSPLRKESYLYKSDESARVRYDELRRDFLRICRYYRSEPPLSEHVAGDKRILRAGGTFPLVVAVMEEAVTN